MIKTALLGMAALGMVSAQPTLQTNSFSVSFNGNSGSFKLYLNGNTNSFYNIRYVSIQELTSTGQPVVNGQGRTLSLGNGVSWTAYESGPNMKGVWGTASGSPNGVNFPVTVAINNMLSTTVNNTVVDNITIPIVANTLKISVNITGWQIAAPTNNLCLWIKMSSNQGNSENNVTNSLVPAPNNAQMLTLPGNGGAYNAQIVMENYAYVQASNGGLVQMPVTLSSDSSLNQQKVLLPGSTTGATVFWDPTIQTVPNSAFTTALSFVAVVVAAFAGFVTLF